MSREPTHRRRRRAAPAALALVPVAVAVAAVACGAPPGLDESGAAATAAVAPTATAATDTPTPSRSATATPRPTPPTPSATGFPETYAVDCRGRPTGAQVVRVLRRDAALLPAGGRVTVETGPLCAGTWQYTVLTVPDREPLAVVTRGEPGRLEVVTAGTNVCSVPVRAQAPTGIRVAAGC